MIDLRFHEHGENGYARENCLPLRVSIELLNAFGGPKETRRIGTIYTAVVLIWIVEVEAPVEKDIVFGARLELRSVVNAGVLCVLPYLTCSVSAEQQKL